MRILNLVEQSVVSAAAINRPNPVVTPPAANPTAPTPVSIAANTTVDFAHTPLSKLTVSEFFEQYVFFLTADDTDIAARYPWYNKYL